MGSCIFEKLLYNTFGLVLKYATQTDKLDILVASGLLALPAWLTAPLIHLNSYLKQTKQLQKGNPHSFSNTSHTNSLYLLNLLSKPHIRFFHDLDTQRQWHFIRASKTGPACPSIQLLFASSFVLLSSCSYCPWKPTQWGWSVCVLCAYRPKPFILQVLFLDATPSGHKRNCSV